LGVTYTRSPDEARADRHVARFFDQSFPAFLATYTDPEVAIGGTIRVQVKRVGSWRLDFTSRPPCPRTDEWVKNAAGAESMGMARLLYHPRSYDALRNANVTWWHVESTPRHRMLSELLARAADLETYDDADHARVRAVEDGDAQIAELFARECETYVF